MSHTLKRQSEREITPECVSRAIAKLTSPERPRPRDDLPNLFRHIRRGERLHHAKANFRERQLAKLFQFLRRTPREFHWQIEAHHAVRALEARRRAEKSAALFASRAPLSLPRSTWTRILAETPPHQTPDPAAPPPATCNAPKLIALPTRSNQRGITSHDAALAPILRASLESARHNTGLGSLKYRSNQKLLFLRRRPPDTPQSSAAANEATNYSLCRSRPVGSQHKRFFRLPFPARSALLP